MVAERTVGRRQAPPPYLIVLDTLSKLEEHVHGIGGYCLDRRRLFNASPPVLILERGRDYSPTAWRRCGAQAAASGARSTASLRHRRQAGRACLLWGACATRSPRRRAAEATSAR